MNTELEKLLEWAKTACEETRAVVGWHESSEDEKLVPSWLPELEAAIIDMEQAQ